MPVYVFSNHDRRRSIKRLGDDFHKAKLLAMLQLTVRGVPCVYYGEEIGMTDHKLPFGSAIDPVPHKFRFLPRLVPDLIGFTINRDEVRTPMQWNGTANAGFSSAPKPWLPLHENYREVNVDVQSKDENSLLNTVRALLKFRKENPPLRDGSLELIDNLPVNVLGYARRLAGKTVFALLNFSDQERDFHFPARNVVFRLTPADTCENGSVHLVPYGGLILNSKR